MARTDSFVEYTVELLEKLGPVQSRSMFGGWGLYFGGRMFGLIAEGQLFLKVDDVTKPDFQAAGCRPFVYEGAGKAVEMGYWTPPADAADDAYALLPWARKAVDAAQRAALKKAPKKKAVAKKAAPKKTAAVKKAAPARKTAAPKKKAAKKPASKKKAARKS
ncbi:TfoX/Sxy family protein [Pyxidicoccus parkwayensis]|uniref:TfoX/Sxy family protein n=1 Tax=Pyxidicoccus parkwayensis TaxID=2813578 RepID=A0ABX7NLU1_9BACT|nr:TfoX/Sxy family protein [Pyxidicoccus parkwaysis]QSQ19608.1 TfoX/Sxy family protein [Pyxidicoccus parkwaysis]